MTSQSNVRYSRVLVACNNCRTRKVKCNRSNPHNSTSPCERCLSKGLRCEYTTIEGDVSNSGVDMSPVYLYPTDHYNYSNAAPPSQAHPAMSTGLPAMPGPGHQLQSNFSRQPGGVQNYPSDVRYPAYSGMPAQSQGGGNQSLAYPYGNPQSNTNLAYVPPSQSRGQAICTGRPCFCGRHASSDASSFGVLDPPSTKR